MKYENLKCLVSIISCLASSAFLRPVFPRHYTVRYREKNKKWNYQTCPTSDTVIDNLKPNGHYEFGVKPTSKDITGTWSKAVIHNISKVGVDGRLDVRFSNVPLSAQVNQFLRSGLHK